MTDEEKKIFRIEASRKYPDIFGQIYLKHELKLGTPQFHRDIYDLIADRSLKRVCVIAAVGHGKSTVLVYVSPIWMACYKTEEEILIISSSAEFAEYRLRKIIDEFETNELLKIDFNIYPDEPWKHNEIKLSNGVRILARGKGSQISGLRPTCMLCDDIETEDEARSEVERERLKSWWYLTVMHRPVPMGRIFLIGSISSKLAFLNNFAGEDAKSFGWTTKIFVPKHGKSIWQELWSDEVLAKKRKELSALPGAYEALVEADTSAFTKYAFKREWLRYYEKTPDNLRIFTAIDPGAGEKESDSYTSILTGGIDVNSGCIYVLDVIKRRYNVETLEMFGAMFMVYDIYKSLKFGFESVAFQKYIKAFFEKECRERGKTPRIIEIKRDTKISKDYRIRSLAHWFEEGKILIRPDQHALIAEYEAYPECVTVDVLDALSMLVNDLIAPGKISVNRGEPPKPAAGIGQPIKKMY